MSLSILLPIHLIDGVCISRAYQTLGRTVDRQVHDRRYVLANQSRVSLCTRKTAQKQYNPTSTLEP